MLVVNYCIPHMSNGKCNICTNKLNKNMEITEKLQKDYGDKVAEKYFKT